MKGYLSAILLSVLFLGAACNPAAVSVTATEMPFYAPDFTLMSLDGTAVTLSELRGTPVLINFWATWCVPCIAEMPALQQLADDFGERLIVLGINLREAPDDVSAFVTQYQIDFTILLHPTDDVVLNYQVINLPQTLLVAPDGTVVYRQFGPVNVDDILSVLTS